MISNFEACVDYFCCFFIFIIIMSMGKIIFLGDVAVDLTIPVIDLACYPSGPVSGLKLSIG